MAFLGQAETQTPQPWQSDGSIKATPESVITPSFILAFLTILGTLNGHSRTQVRQAMHSSGLTWAIMPLMVISFLERIAAARAAVPFPWAMDSLICFGKWASPARNMPS